MANRNDVVLMKVERLENIFKDKIDLRKQRSPDNTPQSLEKLCEMCIVDNIQYFKNKQRPFQALPVLLLERISCNFKSDLCLYSLFIKAQTKRICLKLPQDPSQESLSNFFSYLTTTCKALTYIEFDGNMSRYDCISSWYKELGIFLACLKFVQHLELKSCNINDDMLSIIATTCNETLSYLDISGNMSVTSAGLLTLATSCKELQVLKFSEVFTSEALSRALCLLKKLKLISLNYYGVHTAAINEVYASHKKDLKLESISFTKTHGDTMRNMLSILPCLKQIEMENCNNLTPLQEYDSIHVSELILIYPDLKSVSNIQINQIIQRFCLNLTRLSITLLHDKNGLDIAMIGYFCLNLEYLEFRANCGNVCDYELDNKHFSKLKYLTLLNHSNYFNDQKVLHHILSRPCLKYLKIDDSVVKANTLLEFLNEFKSNKVFSSLTKLRISGPMFSINLIIELICACPRLKDISGDGCLTLSEYFELRLIISRQFPLITSVQFHA